MSKEDFSLKATSSFTVKLTAIIGLLMSSGVSAAPPGAPASFTLDKSSISCAIDGAPDPMARLEAHDFYRALAPGDWALAEPNARWFRGLNAGDSATKQVKLTNLWHKPLVLESITGTSEDFSFLGTLPLTLAAGASTNLGVRFSPKFDSPITQELVVKLKFKGGGTQDVYLWGEVADGRQVENLTDCGILNQPNTVYTLQNDVAAAGTCFAIQANNITLDLNGHKVTYGSNGLDGEHGVYASANYAMDAKPGLAGGSFEAAVVKNGTIEQSGYTAGPAPGGLGHAIYWNQGGGLNAEFSNLTLNVIGHSAQAMRLRQKRKVLIHSNTVNSKVTTIVNRHQIDGAMIWVSASGADNGFVSAYGNTLNGGAQVGIYSNLGNSQFYDNYIAQSSLFTNDFAIMSSANNSDVFRNTVRPVSGRGIQGTGRKARVFENDIESFGLANIAEYGGCQPGGAYGVQLETGAYESLVMNNTIVAISDECDAAGIRVTGPTHPTPGAPASLQGNIVFNNDVYAKKIGAGSGIPSAVSASNPPKGSMISFRNNYKTDGLGIYIDYDGARGFELIQDNFILGDNAASVGAAKTNLWLMYFYNQQVAKNIVLEDLNLAPVFNYDDMIREVPRISWYGNSEYMLAQATLVALNGDQPVMGKLVKDDALGDRAEQMTESAGVSRRILERRVNSAAAARNITYSPGYSPLSVNRKGVSALISVDGASGYESLNCNIDGKSGQ